MRALLDVNMLVALLDEGHLHHGLAVDWLAEHEHLGWASCPLTQNGCLRILSLPGYPNSQPVRQVADRLSEAVLDASHEFWPDDLSLVGHDGVNWSHVLGSRQLTDVYLLALAVRHGARFVTLDQGLSLHAVPAAKPKNLVILK